MDSISILNTAFIICLAMTILFFVVSVVLFFLFDIRTIYMIRSGRAQARTVKEMQEINASTGRLRVGGKTQTGSIKKEKRSKDVIQPPAPAAAQPDAGYYAQDADYSGDYVTTEKLQTTGDGSSETTVLPGNDGSSETTVLPGNGRSSETTVLTGGAETAVLSSNEAAPARTIYFDVIKKISLCDTEEIIP